MKKIVIFGLGRMGLAILEQLNEFKNFEIFVYDINKTKEEEVIKKFENVNSLSKLSEVVYDALNKLKPNIIINATTFYNNLYYTQLAIEVGSNYVDLGQSTWTTLRQRSYDSLAKAKKIFIVPETGLAPGIINIIGNLFIEEGIENVYLYTGGLPINSNLGGPLRYATTWSIEGLIQEYTDLSVSRKDNKIVFNQGILTEIEEIEIKFKSLEIYEKLKNFQKLDYKNGHYYICDLEALITSDGVSLMPFDYPCKNLEYKTIRYKGHYDVIKMLYNLGFFDEARGLRRTTIEMLEKIIPKTNEDMVLMKVIGISGNRTKEFNGIVLYDEKWTAMQKMTGYGCVISALGIIKEIDILKYENYGVFMPYEIFEGKKFLSYLTKFLKHFEFNYD